MVAHLMADHAANGAVVHCVIGIDIEEWRLENARGKGDLIPRSEGGGVHGRRGHSPVIAVDGLADLGKLVLPRSNSPVARTLSKYDLRSIFSDE